MSGQLPGVRLEDEIVRGFRCGFRSFLSVISIGRPDTVIDGRDRSCRVFTPRIDWPTGTLPNSISRVASTRRCVVGSSFLVQSANPILSACLFDTPRKWEKKEKRKKEKDIGQWARKCVEPLSIRGKRNSSHRRRRLEERCLILNHGWHTFTVLGRVFATLRCKKKTVAFADMFRLRVPIVRSSYIISFHALMLIKRTFDVSTVRRYAPVYIWRARNRSTRAFFLLILRKL